MDSTRVWSLILLICSVSKVNSNATSCYWQKCFGKCKYILPTIDESYTPEDNTIYFIHTSCKGGLDAREACAVESAAKANPERPIAVLFAGPLRGEYIEGTTRTLKSYDNVHFYRIDLTQYALNTPFEDLFNKKVWEESPNATTHALDFLRILTLYKYGGIYLDLDMIVVKSFDRLPKNFVSRVDNNTIGTNIIGLSKTDDIGKFLANMTMNYLALNYDAQIHNNLVNGVTDTLRKIDCTNMDFVDELNFQSCQGFILLKSKYFSPVRDELWGFYFKSKYEGIVWEMDKLEEVDVANAVAHHLWNSQSSQTDIQLGSYFDDLAQEYCRKTFKLFGEHFGKF